MKSRLTSLTLVSLLLSGAFAGIGFAAPGVDGPMSPATLAVPPVANPAEPSPCGQPAAAADFGFFAPVPALPPPQGCGACGCEGPIGSICELPLGGWGFCERTLDRCPQDGLWRCECVSG